MELEIKKDKLEKYLDNQFYEYYHIEGLPKGIECNFKIIYGEKYRDFNISPNDYYATFVDIEKKSVFISLWHDNFDINYNRQGNFEEIIKAIVKYMPDNFSNYNIFFYDVDSDIEGKIVEKYAPKLEIGKYKAKLYLIYEG